MSIQGVIFDLDGTLVDTLGDLTDSMNAGLRQVCRPPRSADECRQMIGHGLRKFAERALGPEHRALTDVLLVKMAAYYKDHCLLKTTVYPGMQETLTALFARGIRMAVLTNKNQVPADIITQHFFGQLFDPIVGADDGCVPKPDPRTTQKILAGWGLSEEMVIFVGDSETDIQTATNAGIRCLACEWGFRTPQQLSEAGTAVMIQRPERILDIVFNKSG